MRHRTVAIGLIAICCLYGCKKETWSGFYYPDKSDLTIDESLGVFPTLDQCREAALSRIEATQNNNATYECGLNCNKSRGKPYFCDKTEL
jgi:hypothetical protein